MEPTGKMVFFLLLLGSLILASPLLSPAVGKPSFASSNFPSSNLAFSSLTPLQHCPPSLFPRGRKDNFASQSQHTKMMQPSVLIVDIWEQYTAHCLQPPSEDGVLLILPTVEQDTGWLFLPTLSIGSHIHIQGHSWASHTGAESRAMAGWHGPRKDKGNPEIYFSSELEEHSSSWPVRDWNKLRLLCWTHCNWASLYAQSYLSSPTAANCRVLLEQEDTSTKGIAWACIWIWYRGINRYSLPRHRLLVHYWCSLSCGLYDLGWVFTLLYITTTGWGKIEKDSHVGTQTMLYPLFLRMDLHRVKMGPYIQGEGGPQF